MLPLAQRSLAPRAPAGECGGSPLLWGAGRRQVAASAAAGVRSPTPSRRSESGRRLVADIQPRGDELLDDGLVRGVVAPSAQARNKRRWTGGSLGESASLAAMAAQEAFSTVATFAPTASTLARSVTRVRHAPHSGFSTQPPRPKKEIPNTQLSDSVLLRFERDGFVVTRNLLPTDAVSALRNTCEAEVTQRKLESLRMRVRVLCPGVAPSSIQTEADARNALKKHATDELGFLQFFNLHRINQIVAKVALGPELAMVAAQLLDARRVRVYQDCLFLKEPGFMETNWHSDLRMAPFDTNAFVTAWIPLRPIRGARSERAAGGAAGPADSGLMFAAGSHRDFALPFWRADMDGMDLECRNYAIKDQGPMEVGDVSWHNGWTLHAAAPQPMGTPPRLALSVAFFADGARLLPHTDKSVRQNLMHDEDAESYAAWMGSFKGREGAVARHRLLPVVWPMDASEAASFPLRN